MLNGINFNANSIDTARYFDNFNNNMTSSLNFSSQLTNFKDLSAVAIQLLDLQSPQSCPDGSYLTNRQGIKLVERAENEINHISVLLNNMSTLASQAASGVYSSTQLSDLNVQFQAYMQEIDRVANSTNFSISLSQPISFISIDSVATPALIAVSRI